MRLCGQIIAETSKALANLPPRSPLPAFARKFCSIISNEQTLIPPYPYPYPYPYTYPYPYPYPYTYPYPYPHSPERDFADEQAENTRKC